jgi:hypothetical protein
MVYMTKSSTPTKMTKGPRVALRLPRDAQGLHTRGLAIWSAIKADAAHFPNPYPPAAEVEADLAGLGPAVAANKVRQTLELLGK